jgi:hypothetical protein
MAFRVRRQPHSLMSHQWRATSLTFPRHTIVLTDAARQCWNNQNVIAIVAILPARIWRGRGISTSTAAINPAMVYEGETDIAQGKYEGRRTGWRKYQRPIIHQETGLLMWLHFQSASTDGIPVSETLPSWYQLGVIARSLHTGIWYSALQ